MQGEGQDATKHIHLQWFAEGDEAGASADADQSSDGTPEGKAADSRGESAASGENGKDSVEPKIVSAEEHARVKAEYERLLQVFKEKEGREKKQRDQALAKQGEYQKLYNETLQELEATKPKLERMTAIVKAMLDAELQGLPKDFDKGLLPAGDADVQLDWLLKAKKAGLFASVATPAPRRPGDGTPPQRGAASEGFMSIYQTQRK